jgi:adenylyl/guanylyl cyclase-like protein with sensor domain/cyclic GMP-AMP synthase DncV-like protein
MFMYDLTADLQSFYDTFVRLGTDRRKQLGGYRDLNIARLKGGLDDLAAETGRRRPHPYATKNQGGYAMHTLNQDPRGDNGYDIDVALIFDKDDLPDDPLTARQRMRDALAKRCTNFTQEPEVRTNAVTVWYAEGYHVDFAIYRSYIDAYGREQLEHASTTWKRRDPMEVNNWFISSVAAKSPKANPALGYYLRVADGQMRRIVRYIKWFSRSRTGWSLPGGMVISTLVAEVYRPDPNRDDRALYDTLTALRDRLNGSCDVANPINGSSDLTANQEVLHQVERLRDSLSSTLSRLSILFDQQNCTREKARSAWDWVFNHDFWAKKEAMQKSVAEDIAALPTGYSVAVRCDLARNEGGTTYKQYASGSSVLPKGVSLKFSVVATTVPQPYTVRWSAQNEGDEAREVNQMSWNRIESASWTTTKFKGRHTMTCQIEKEGAVLARSVHVVRVAAGGKWRGFV